MNVGVKDPSSLYVAALTYIRMNKSDSFCWKELTEWVVYIS
jgi:hypothetical protein